MLRSAQGARLEARMALMQRHTYLICGRDALFSRAIGGRRGFMDGVAVADLAGIVAPINFTQPMAEKPYSYNYEAPPGVPPRNTREETHQVKIFDGRAVADRLSLD